MTFLSQSTIRWFIQDEVVISAFPTSETYLVLWNLGIRAILTLCSESEGTLPPFSDTYPFLWQRIVLPDSHYPDPLDPRDLGRAVDTVQAWVHQKLPVCVHCLAGIERSPLVALTYLCVQHQLELWEAQTLLKQQYPRATLRSAQLQIVRNYLKQRGQLRF